MTIEKFGPSGMCEGVECYTANDIAQTEAALADAEAAAAQSQAEADADAQTAQEWQDQLDQAQMNQCPC